MYHGVTEGAASAQNGEDDSVAAFFELRDYRIKDGKRNRWAKWMEEKAIPFQTERGMTVVGTWIDRDQPDRYVWMRRFESEEQYEALRVAVYQDP
jgi:hypothetical protein